jgi:pimeloyl-ACP methyl ester carboxylesterase
MIQISSLLAQSWFQKEHYKGFGNFLQTPHGSLHFVDLPGNAYSEPKSNLTEQQGVPTIFIHGNLGWSYEWRYILASASARVIAPDLLGFGLSHRGKHPLSLDVHAELLASLIVFLKLKKFNIVAHDLGSQLGLRLIQKFPNFVHKVIFINAWYDQSKIEAPSTRFAAKNALKWVSLKAYLYFGFTIKLVNMNLWKYVLDLPEKDKQSFFQMQPFGHRHQSISFRRQMSVSNHLSLENQESIASLSLPALILWGKKDSLLDRHHLAQWQNMIPDAPTVIFSKSGHWPHLDNAETTSEVIHQFIADY